MKIYYHERLDILCIVAGKKIWKYLGGLCENPLMGLVVDKHTWYEAEVNPKAFALLPDKGGWVKL